MDIDIFITAYNKQTNFKKGNDISGLYLVLFKKPMFDRFDKNLSIVKLYGEITSGLCNWKDNNDMLLAIYSAFFTGALEELELERIYPRPFLQIYTDDSLFIEQIKIDYNGENKCIKDIYNKYKTLLYKLRKKIELTLISKEQVLKKFIDSNLDNQYWSWLKDLNV